MLPGRKLGRANVEEQIGLAAVGQPVTEVANPERQVVQQSQRPEPFLEKAREIVLELDLGEIAVLTQVPGGGVGKGAAFLGDQRLSEDGVDGSCGARVLRAHTGVDVGANAQLDLAARVKCRSVPGRNATGQPSHDRAADDPDPEAIPRHRGVSFLRRDPRDVLRSRIPTRQLRVSWNCQRFCTNVKKK